MKMGDTRHQLVKGIMGQIRCCYCGDDARDAVVIAERQNTEIQYGSGSPSSESSITRNQHPLPVAGGDGGLRLGVDKATTPERRRTNANTNHLGAEPGSAIRSNEAAPDPSRTEVGSEKANQPCSEHDVGPTNLSSPLLQKSSKAPEPTTPTVHGTLGQSAARKSQRTAQTDNTVDLRVVGEPTDKDPSSALLPSFDHASGMDMQLIRHSSLTQRREGAFQMPPSTSREGFDKSPYDGMVVSAALSGLGDASGYTPSHRSFIINGRGYSSQGALRGCRDDPNDWQSNPYFAYPPSDYQNWSAPSRHSIPSTSCMLDYNPTKVEDLTTSYEMPNYSRRSTALVDNQYALYDLHQQPASTDSWEHGHAPVRSVNDTMPSHTTLLQDVGDHKASHVHKVLDEPSLEREESTTKRGLST